MTTEVEVIESDEDKRGPGRPKGSVKVVDNASFLRSGHEFDSIIKKGKNDMVAIMAKLAEIVESEKSTNSERIKAADIYTSTYNSMVAQRNKDEITRKIAEVRVRNVTGGGTTEDDGMAELDFDIPDEFAEESEQNS